jgi:RHS repeat-associated protein
MAYCANLGHQTAEYGLIYMRARYYEPSSGRFISVNPGRDGWNWSTHTGNEPANRVDQSAKLWWSVADTIIGVDLIVLGIVAASLGAPALGFAIGLIGLVNTLIGAWVTIGQVRDQRYEKTYLERPWSPEMGQRADMPGNIFRQLNAIKSGGSPLEKIVACQMEALVWLIMGEE